MSLCEMSRGIRDKEQVWSYKAENAIARTGGEVGNLGKCVNRRVITRMSFFAGYVLLYSF